MKIIKLFLRLAIAFGFLSASADRLGMWPKESSAWGNWDSFLEYTQVLNPWVPDTLIPTVGTIATAAEIIFAIFLIIGFKTELFAKLSGILLLIFALSMTFTIGIKSVFDYSVFTASAAAFALSFLKEKYLEVDLLIAKANKSKV
ncbi:DoxX family protein [Gelidibacter pelagius]|uniref:DoxX family protein n=1 Tax=Gelidibacter pelagius TaxID=2819985 RepID=A0ABS3SW66_9FLAO|nr:DoxX family protein [Gelidibacter pelagius]MBO3099942.1 DoxX family protein [Gelidibacter pelagius]